MRNITFPQQSSAWDDVRAEMEDAREGDLPWRDPRNFKAAYYAGDDLYGVATDAFNMHIAQNGVFAGTAYPSLAKYETEVIGMLLDLLHAPAGATGSTSAGGTESVIMCMKTARGWAREHKPDVTKPTVIVPQTAHAAFAKGGEMLGLKVVRMAESVDWRADVAGMRDAIDDDTIMIVGSAPPYPYGETDPIEEIAALADAHGLWMHVDACIGGMILPFMRMLGDPIPPFDFAVPAVRSMSVDLHKFGYAHKGVSAVLLRRAGDERHQLTEFEDWPAGVYRTANITGSRSGGALASAWAVMRYLGRDGYKRIFGAQRAIKERLVAGIRAIDGLDIVGTPHALHVIFTATDVDIFAVEDITAARGWLSTRMRKPDAIMLWLNLGHAEAIDAYLDDLADAVRLVKEGGLVADDRGTVYITRSN